MKTSLFSLATIFNLFGTALLRWNADSAFIYICIEMQSYSLYLLVASNPNSSQEAFLYFIVGGIGRLIVLLGFSLDYFALGEGDR